VLEPDDTAGGAGAKLVALARDNQGNYYTCSADGQLLHLCGTTGHMQVLLVRWERQEL
jgi:hypothetical protein